MYAASTHKSYIQLVDLDEVGREDAFFPLQLPLQPSFLAGLGDVLDHISCLHSELVTHGALKVHQHQHLCRAENSVLCTKAGVSPGIHADIFKPRQICEQWRLN